MKKLIVVAGPTASGKSSLALKIAKKFDAVIINADSRQIYKDMFIATATPRPDSIRDKDWIIDGIVHKLYGFVSPKDQYTLFQYQRDCFKAIDSSEKLCILTGGTGLYIDSVVKNFDLQQENESAFSRELLNKKSLQELRCMIGKDIEKLNMSDRSNPRRLIRFIERSGNNLDQLEPKYDVLYLVLNPEMSELDRNIDFRTERMFKEGLIEEYKSLIKKYGKENRAILNTIGYKELRDSTDLKNIEDIKVLIKTHTRQYAKRQITWFKRNKNAIWIKPEESIDQIVEKFLREK